MTLELNAVRRDDFITLAGAAGHSVTVAPERGALVTSLNIAGRELLYMDEATLFDANKNVRGGNPVLFPAPGKLTDDAWRQAGKSGVMKQHGFARNLPWKATVCGTQAVELELCANEVTLAHYPWRFRTQLRLTWIGTRLRVTTVVCNEDQTAMPYALGFHPYFAVADKARARIPTAATSVYNNVTKRRETFAGFDFAQPEVDLHLLDHGDSCFLDLHEGSGVELTASKDFSVWVVWTVSGKNYICVEPWTAAGNAMNSGERLSRLAPGESRESWFEIGWRGGGAS